MTPVARSIESYPKIALTDAEGDRIELHRDRLRHNDNPACCNCWQPLDTGDPIVVTQEDDGPFCSMRCAFDHYVEAGFTRRRS